MNLIIDTNIIISALIKDSVTRAIITKSGWKFYYPSISLKEIEKYKGLILEKSRLSEEEYNRIFAIIISYVRLLPLEKLNVWLEDATKIFGNIDKDDIIFIAAALSTENDGIWSDDEHFQKQKGIKIFRTKDVINLLRE